jgi:hypothetical protein
VEAPGDTRIASQRSLDTTVYHRAYQLLIKQLTGSDGQAASATDITKHAHSSRCLSSNLVEVYRQSERHTNSEAKIKCCFDPLYRMPGNMTSDWKGVWFLQERIYEDMVFAKYKNKFVRETFGPKSVKLFGHFKLPSVLLTSSTRRANRSVRRSLSQRPKCSSRYKSLPFTSVTNLVRRIVQKA